MGIPVDAPDGDVRALLAGQQFAIAGLHGVVEADFFDWPATIPEGTPVIRAIARRLSQFAWDDVAHDVLKVLYESIIDAPTRKRMGEYYTPDWLAEKIVLEQYTEPLTQKLLDPACGSGTFLFAAIRQAVDACDQDGMTAGQSLEHVVGHVFGMDLHPVAVTLARVTYLLALTPDRIRTADRGEITVQVYLGDSVRWEQEDTLLTQGGITVHTSDGLELFEQDLHFPEGVVEEPQRFDRLVAALADRAADRRVGTKPPGINGLLNAHKVAGEEDRDAVDTVFRKLCRLYDAGRDHLWSYYIRNLARPLSFTRADGRVDVLVGNPPWLAYRHMPVKLQRTYKDLAEQRRMWAGGGVAPHQDLSDLFVARSVEQYLKVDGRFAFVMPYAVLSRFAYAGFRTADWSASNGEVVHAALGPAEVFATVKPAMFPVPSCVVAGTRAAESSPLTGAGTVWTGKVAGHHIGWAAAQGQLEQAANDTALAARHQGSAYGSRFRQGTPFVPRMLIKVREEESGPLGGPVGQARVSSSRSSIEKEPWRSLPSQTGTVERRFLFKTHLGASVVAFRAREPELAVVPWLDGKLLEGHDERLDEFPGLADWWRRAERTWERERAPATKLSLREQLDFQGKTRIQFPASEHRVVYTTSGQYLAACRIDDPSVLIEQTLYWAPVASEDEGRYLCTIFNSNALAAAVTPLQSRGQHNPRHFAMSVFAIPFPLFDAGDPGHRALADLGARAETVAAAVLLDDAWQFQKARRVVREALRDDGVATEIDAAVADLLKVSAPITAL